MPDPIDLLASGQKFTRGQRPFVRSAVVQGDNRGQVFTVPELIAGRYEPRRFHASAGRCVFLQGWDQKLKVPVEIKCIVRHDVEVPARSRSGEAITVQLRGVRKLLEAERRLLVHVRNAGSNAVPHPNDYVFDQNPQLEGPFATEDLDEWTYDDPEMTGTEPYLILRPLLGEPLDLLLRKAPGGRWPEPRSLRLIHQLAGALRVLHQPVAIRPGMTWQMIFQDLSPREVWVSAMDQVSLLRLDCCQLLNLDSGLKLFAGSVTSGFAAPECRSAQTLSPAADVYSLGAILFQLLSGRAPEAGQGPSLDPGRLEGCCRKETRDFIVRCLSPNPSDRWADGAALEKGLAPLMRTP